MKVKIKRITRKDRETSDGRKYTSVGILVDGKNGETWLNGFENDVTREWNTGETVEIEVEKNGKYLNFKTTGRKSRDDRTDQITDLLAQVIDRLDAIESKLGSRKQEELPPPVELGGTEDDDIPF